jgi:alanyl-tRNA synthetase
MDAQTVRQTFLSYLSEYGHAVIAGASLVPEHDPSVLFTTAGMHPLVPYLLGEVHPLGVRLANVQRCVRTGDIEEVGDATHLTFFEMLGNWSLGDYWKREAIALTYELLTHRFGLDPARFYVTCFAGDADAPRDKEAAAAWRALGIPDERILFLPKADNWWGPAGTTGPCGPDSEVFYDITPDGPVGQTPITHPARFPELCNNVFLQYDRQPDGSFGRLAQRNVDMGMGLERMLAVLQGVPSVYDTDLFAPIMAHIAERATTPQPFGVRVVADHARAAVNILAEGVEPGNVDQPYVVRRLIRRAIRYGREIGMPSPFLADLGSEVIDTLAPAYGHLWDDRERICASLDEEERRFGRTLARGEQQFEKVFAHSGGRIDGDAAFHLYDTYGFPVELTQELAARRGGIVDRAGFESAFRQHQEQSRAGAAERFRGGLAERNPATTRLHTATHLLQAALRDVLGTHVHQRGSNITTERLRFDFNHPEKLTLEQLAEVERRVNADIVRDLPIGWTEMPVAEAQAAGVLGVFGERYGERVKVYSIGERSREICGGPHVAHTSELGHFRIVKEEAVGSGVRRIRAVLEGDGA